MDGTHLYNQVRNVKSSPALTEHPCWVSFWSD